LQTATGKTNTSDGSPQKAFDGSDIPILGMTVEEQLQSAKKQPQKMFLLPLTFD
jgi:hypothetical protein